jgi:hypothetical protein
MEDAVAGGAIGVFMSPVEKRRMEHGPSAKEMRAISSNDAGSRFFLELAFGRSVGDASAKR